MKKVIVISTSLRRGSNSDMLADKFVEGAKAAGNDVEKISLIGKEIQFCDVYLLTTAADDEEQTPKRAEMGLCGWIECFPESHMADSLFCGGVNAPARLRAMPNCRLLLKWVKGFDVHDRNTTPSFPAVAGI